MRIVDGFLLRVALATGVIVGTATLSNQANATTYVFSYTVDAIYPSSLINPAYNGSVISGSFNGTPDHSIAGDIDISSVNSVYFNGHALSGPLYAWQYTDAGGDCSTCWSLGGAVASLTNPLNNNFLFINSSSPGFSGYTNYFYIIPWPNGGQSEAVQFYSIPTGYVDLYNGEFVAGNLSITATPLPSTWMMLIAGVVGFGFFAYRATKKSGAAIAA